MTYGQLWGKLADLLKKSSLKMIVPVLEKNEIEVENNFFDFCLRLMEANGIDTKRDNFYQASSMERRIRKAAIALIREKNLGNIYTACLYLFKGALYLSYGAWNKSFTYCEIIYNKVVKEFCVVGICADLLLEHDCEKEVKGIEIIQSSKVLN